jgi:hypothetical protein
MAQRYRRILGAAKYYAAIDNYIKYITDSTKKGENVGKGKARPEQQVYYINPFGLDLGGRLFIKVSAAKPTFDKYKSAVTAARAKETLTAGTEKMLRKPEGFQPAKAIITTGRVSGSANAKVSTSKVTGMKYLNYGGTSTSMAFGKGTDTETFVTAAAAIKTAIIGVTAGAVVTIKDENTGV